MNKMPSLTELRFAAISSAVMAQEQRILIIFCGIIPASTELARSFFPYLSPPKELNAGRP